LYGLVDRFPDDFVPGGCFVAVGQPESACLACERHFDHPGCFRADDEPWTIDVVRVLPGRDPYQLRDQRWGALTSLDDALAEPFTDDPWVFTVVGIVQEVIPDVELAGDATAPDVVWHDGRIVRAQMQRGDGSFVADVSPEGVLISVDVFEVAWRLCTELVERAGCLAFLMYDDLPIDAALTVDVARIRYGGGL
jgi:hypothetical protein